MFAHELPKLNSFKSILSLTFQWKLPKLDILNAWKSHKKLPSRTAMTIKKAFNRCSSFRIRHRSYQTLKHDPRAGKKDRKQRRRKKNENKNKSQRHERNKHRDSFQTHNFFYDFHDLSKSIFNLILPVIEICWSCTFASGEKYSLESQKFLFWCRSEIEL